MSQIKVLFFASLREQIGTAEIYLSANNLAELFAQIETQLGSEARLALQADNIRIAVNQDLVEHEVALEQGDEVAFLPPVTGG
ncbi:MAG: molybdopterin converting factor subunit 1 [Pseudomonadaceae bacterium]|jgi:molybdopterin synthase sulfur carrier subunit|nr:molybdopterin converting factor subunit 1 [Pseudomonadaceae bacterium]